MIGKTLNHFTIISRLGKGGMGEVYVAEDSRLKRKIALKVLPEEMSNDPERLERFQREAEAIAALNHPNVVVIHSVEESEGVRFLTMELVEGKPLSEIIPSTGLDLKSFFDIAIPVAEALSSAHQQGIIHRDLKPANIMVSYDGRVKILDFGLAKRNRVNLDSQASDLETSARTGIGIVMGTVPYMSPEQAMGQEVDARSDIFSFGVVLYQLASGRLPFPGPSVTQILAGILRDDVPRLDPNAVPVDLERIIRLCLVKDREKRYSSVLDLAADLRALRDRILRANIPSAEKHREGTNNLPLETTSFIGREEEVAEIRRLLSSHRLVTVIGSGGAGKTRLAFEAARRSLAEYPDGVWQVSLALITGPELVLQSIVETLSGNKEPNQPMRESLANHLKGRKLLLILDSCEHVLDQVAQITDEILHTDACPAILTTSREALNVPGEYVWTIPSLSFPAPNTVVTVPVAMRSDAVRLFVDRAVARDPRFVLQDANVGSVAAICARLDGIPLAIELAAARIKVMSAGEIHKRLDDCFKLLTGGSRGSLQRHQTLRATVDWSYELLSPEERILFRRLSCFTGSFDLEALENVCGWGVIESDTVLDHLSRLVDKSLVLSERTAKDQVRYRLLEPLRQYAKDKLQESGETGESARRHFSHYTELADRAYDERVSSATEWLDRLERDHDNLRSALGWASQHDPESELRLAGALAWFWILHTHFSEGRRWLRRVLVKKPGRTREAARALCGASALAAFQGDYAEGGEPAEEGLAIWREIGDKREIALALDSIGWHLLFAENKPAALEAFEESLAIHKESGDERLINRATLNICQVLVSEFDVDRAEPMAQQCLEIALQHDEPRDIHFAHHFLADCALVRGDVQTARLKYADSLRAAVRIGDRFEISFEIEGISMALAGMGRDVKAMRLDGAVQAEHEAQKSIVVIGFWEDLKARYLWPAEKRMEGQTAEMERQNGRKMGFEAAIEYALDSASD